MKLPAGSSQKLGNNKEFANRSGLVHRLDKKTSGLMVLAKTPQAFEALQDQFKKRTVIKKYLALVHGTVKDDKGTITKAIGFSKKIIKKKCLASMKKSKSDLGQNIRL